MENIDESMKEKKRKYYSMIPNIIDDLRLTASEIRLYLHYKRRAGELQDGRCYESTETTARFLRMSKSTVCNVRKKLAQQHLIEIKKIPRGHGEYAYCEVKIGDIWELNKAYYDSLQSTNRPVWVSDLKKRLDIYHGIRNKTLSSTETGQEEYSK